MKQYQIINAYKNLETLSENENLTDLDQWKLYKLRKTLRPHVDFQVERETAIREKYVPYANENGIIEGEHVQEYMNELQDLSQIEVEIEEFTKPKIKMAKGMTLKIVEPLEDFIEFTEPAE